MPEARLACVRDTANTWVLRHGRDAVCIDIGAGTVFDRLDELEVDRITDVLVTHAHRDSTQGLQRAVEAGARVWVPPVERELFTGARGRWARRRIDNSYELRQEALTPFEDVEIAGIVDEYRTRAYGGVEIHTLPTPGHTMGSVTYLADVDGRKAAFCGDLLYGGGRVWSLAATQWSYTGVEGQASTLLSLNVLAARRPDVLLPAHGEAIDDPPAALAETERRLAELMELRRIEEMPFAYHRWLESPWRLVLPHLLANTTSISCSYAVLSESGSALLIDWGYDLWTGWPLGGERHECRPLLESIAALRRDYGVERVEAVVPTHYHDDHVAGVDLLRDVEGTELWAPENVAPILEAPHRYDIPCLWFDPIPVDRVLPFDEPVRWHEYELRVHPLPGHTRYAAAIELEVDGRRVLATGDQQSHEQSGRMIPNYQYRNRFSAGDYVRSAALYERLRPDVLLTGHWGAHDLSAPQLHRLAEDGRRLEELHRELLPHEGADARVVPYRATAGAGATVELVVELQSPFDHDAEAEVELVVPDGWSAEPARGSTAIPARGAAAIPFRVTTAGSGRQVVAADVTIGGLRLGPVAEALVTVA